MFLRDIAKVYTGYGKNNLPPKTYTGNNSEEWEAK